MNRIRGFSLLEALIALVVITIGVLGVAGQQVASVYRTHVGEIRSLAAVEAQSITAAMLANPGASVPIASSEYITADVSSVSPPSVDCKVAACSPDEMAHYDLYNWAGQLQRSLPQGNASIACTSSPSGCKVTISWNEKQSGVMVTRDYSIWARP